MLKQFAVYTPTTGSSKKRTVRQTAHDRRHGHQQFHGHNKEVREAEERAEEVKRSVGSLVTATMANGAVITFTNKYGAASATTSTTTTSTATVLAVSSSIATSSSAASSSKSTSSSAASVTPVAATSSKSSSSSAPASTASAYASSGSWARQAYYSSDKGTADGVVFLNNMGGGASGVFDMYANLHVFHSSRPSLIGG